jgi:hypothetical protein
MGGEEAGRDAVGIRRYQRLWQETVRDAVTKQCPPSLVRGVAEDGIDPGEPATAVYGGVRARRGRDGWALDGTGRHVLDGDRADRLAVVADAGVFVIDAGHVPARRCPVFDPVLHVADLSSSGIAVPDTARVSADSERARHVALTGMAIMMVGACQQFWTWPSTMSATAISSAYPSEA